MYYTIYFYPYGLLSEKINCIYYCLLHNAVARITNRTLRHEHITPILHELHWLPITKRVQFKVVVYTFKALHNEAPIILCYITVKLSRRLLDTAAAILWNDLPDNIRNCDATWTFKKLLKTYLF